MVSQIQGDNCFHRVSGRADAERHRPAQNMHSLSNPSQHCLLLDNKPVAGIDLLMKDENLMNVERVGWPFGDGVAHNLKQILESGCIVDVDLSNTLVAIHEESHL